MFDLNTTNILVAAAKASRFARNTNTLHHVVKSSVVRGYYVISANDLYMINEFDTIVRSYGN